MEINYISAYENDIEIIFPAYNLGVLFCAGVRLVTLFPWKRVSMMI